MRRSVVAGFLAYGVTTWVSAQTLSFDQGESLPFEWVAEASGGVAADWKVVRDPHVLSAPHALTIAQLNDKSRSNFNVFWSPKTRLLNGSLEVNVRAQSGAIDRGGGLIWRVQDKNNYYIARYNPLERNLRLYYVQDGVRRKLADAPGLNIGSDEWFTLKVTHRGERIEVFLNGKQLIEKNDSTFSQAGGVGVWTKADAVSLFDNFKVNISE